MVLSCWRRWFNLQATFAKHPCRQARRCRSRRLHFELLEGRWLASANGIGDSPIGNNGLIFLTSGPTLTTTAITSSPNASVFPQPTTFTPLLLPTPPAPPT